MYKSLVLIVSICFVSVALAATSPRDKAWLLLEGGPVGSAMTDGTFGYGVSTGLFVPLSSSFSFGYVAQGGVVVPPSRFSDDSLRVADLGAAVQIAFMKSWVVTALGGVRLLQLKAADTAALADPLDEERVSLTGVGGLAIGNRWFFASHFSLGVDWIGVNAKWGPHLYRQNRGQGYEWIERRDVIDTSRVHFMDTHAKAYVIRFLALSAGLAF